MASHVESAIEAYLSHYGRIAINDMQGYFGFDNKRKDTTENLYRRWDAVFSRRGLGTRPKVVKFAGIRSANDFIRQKKLTKLSVPRGK